MGVAVAKSRVMYDECPLCQGRNMVFVRAADCSQHPLYRPIISPTMTWLRCTDCEHVFTDGYFSNEAASAIFENTNESQKPGWAFEQQRITSAKIVARIAQHAAVERWLDVGFGNGSLLFTAAEWGFNPIGLDLRRSSVEAMHQLGIEAFCTDISTFDQTASFSVVSLADVLEHMPFPISGLQAAHRLLQPEGILFLSMPHYDCLAWRLLDRINANPYWCELEHFHNFSLKRLNAMLQGAGFRQVSYNVSERYRIGMEVIAQRVG
jgi:SAM-dependent methyltransferase